MSFRVAGLRLISASQRLGKVLTLLCVVVSCVGNICCLKFLHSLTWCVPAFLVDCFLAFYGVLCVLLSLGTISSRF